MPVNEQVVDSVASANMKTLGDGPAFFQNQAFANAIAHQNRMNILAETAVASAVRSVATTPSEESQADLPSLLSALLAALGSSQQAAKVAQSTPPETAKPG